MFSERARISFSIEKIIGYLTPNSFENMHILEIDFAACMYKKALNQKSC